MYLHQLFSRRNATRKVDFRPDNRGQDSPFLQLRRLRHYLANDMDGSDLAGCDDAVNALREYSYRKIYTGTTHDEFLRLELECPEHIDYTVAVHETEADRFKGKSKTSPTPSTTYTDWPITTRNV